VHADTRAAGIREHVLLSGYTTLRLGGPAARFVEASSDEQLTAAVRAADLATEPVLVLGGGSNLVVADEGFPGVVVRVATRGITITPAADDGARPGAGTAGAVTAGFGAAGSCAAGSGAGGAVPAGSCAAGDRGSWVAVTVAAGEDWDSFTDRCAAEQLSGLECLAGIPGLAGATPIQNVGAYGHEVAETITSVRAYDRLRGQVVELANADCGFGYRTSAFKARAGRPGAPMKTAAATRRFVVVAVTFRLGRDPLSAPVGYAELARALGVPVGGRVPLAEARRAVLELRRGKGMVLDPADPDTRSAGSFFTNPVLDRGQFAELGRRAAAGAALRPGAPHAAVPHFAAAGGLVKVPAAWLIENAGFGKGYPAGGNARISGKHTLALTNPGRASTADLMALAAEIRAGVRAAFGVELTSEPVLVGASF